MNPPQKKERSQELWDYTLATIARFAVILNALVTLLGG